MRRAELVVIAAAAFFWLGQSNDPRALDFFAATLK